jgi:UDP-2-acetamido-3-amino-2,3-dideoxy-glucuronate N-acetyltransferase
MGPEPDDPMIHPTAIVEEGAVIGTGTKVWHRCHLRSGSRIGEACTLGFAVYVDTGVVIGDRCKIQNHTSLYQGVVLEDDVFVGPGVVFTNDRYPRAPSMDWEIVPTTIRSGASLGANATVICGIEVGAWSMVGAGAVLTRDAPAHGLMLGAPARLVGWVCVCGRPLSRLGQTPPQHCPTCGRPVIEMVPA